MIQACCFNSSGLVEEGWLPDGSPLLYGYDQHTVIAQIARAVFDNFTPGFYFVIAMTGIRQSAAAIRVCSSDPLIPTSWTSRTRQPADLGSTSARNASAEA